LFSVELKDGRTVLVRGIDEDDKEKLVQMYASLSSETLRWGMPPYTREAVERWLSNLSDLILIVAVDGDKIVGHSHIRKFPHARRRGTGDLVIYIHQNFHNVGLGTEMLRRLLKLAKEQGLHRIGLSVIGDNKRAIHVYEKVGFKIEGVLRDAYFGEDGKYHDEIEMGLILS
jgi:RimJ/RimL family protein N-acetyltransferase